MIIDVSHSIQMKTLTEDNAKEVFKLIEKDRAYLRQWLPWVDNTYSVEEVERTIISWEVVHELGSDLVLGIFKDGLYIGNIGLHDIKKRTYLPMIGYWLAQDEQGKGIMSACVKSLMNYAFTCLSIDKLYIHCVVTNFKSRAIPERLAFKLEKIQEDGQYLYDKYYDLAIYSFEFS